MADSARFIEFELPEPDALRDKWNVPDQADVSYRAGWSLLMRGHFPEAAAAFDRAVRYNPAHSRARVGRSEVQVMLGHARDAIPEINAALERYGADPLLGAARGHLYLHEDDLDNALECCDIAVRLAPDHAYPRLIAGEARLALRHGFDSAEEYFGEARVAENTWPDLPTRIGLAYLEWNYMDRALNVLKAVTDAHPRYVLGWIVYGDACRVAGKSRRCRAAYERALALEPDLDAVRNALGVKARVSEGARVVSRFVNRLLMPDD